VEAGHTEKNIPEDKRDSVFWHKADIDPDASECLLPRAADIPCSDADRKLSISGLAQTVCAVYGFSEL
jgi:hypothetical protein